MPKDDWVFWLNLTNIALGLVVVVAVLVTAYGLVWEIMSRLKKRESLAKLDEKLTEMVHGEFAHGLPVQGLGMTMADGGEPRKPLPEESEETKQK